MTKREREREASSAVVPSEPVEFINDDFSDDDFSDLNKRYKGEASSAAVVPKEKRENVPLEPVEITEKKVPLEPVEITNDDDDFFYYNFVRIYYNFVRKVKINKEFRLNPNPVQVPQDEDDFSDDDDFGFDRADDFSDRYPYDPYDDDDFNFSDLPPDLGKTRARTYICGPFKLQVLEIIHEYFPMIHGQLQSQFEQCKIKMTDGVQTVYGLVCLPIKALQVSNAPNGLKVIISGATVRRGILMLTPENTKVLGGKQLDEQVLKQVLKRVVDDPSHRGKTFIINDAVQACNHGKKYDDLITEFCNETSGLVVCFGEMLIDFVPTVGGVSLAEVPAFNTAPCGTANVAVGISKLGGESAFICKVGADEFGYMMADSLKQNNVDTSGMRFHSNARTTLAFVTHRANGEREILFFRNPKSDMLLDKSELDHNLIKQAKIFHYGSISLIDEPCKSAHLAALRIAKDSDCILSYDPNLRLTLWPSAEAARNGIMSIWDLADVIKISEDEITFLTGGGDPYDDDVVLNKLFHPNLKLLIVTEGSESCRYYTKDFKGKVRGVNVKPVGTTGVGDAFVSGILYKIAYDPSIFEDEEGLQKALKFAMGFDVLSKKNIAITDDDHSRPTSPLPPVLEPQTSDCPVNHHLFKLGFGLKADKVAECLRQLGDLLNGFDVPQKAKICFQKFLFSDLNSCGSGVLPHIDEKMLKTSLHGPFILQVDEIIHGCCPLQIERCLMFKMTDGVQTVYGIELKPIEALQVCAPRGLKVEISNVEVRRGLLILVPENIKVLGGGLVKQLDEEVLKEVLKPVVDDPSHSSSTLNITDAVQASNQGKTDDLITESSNKTSGLVVCFGEMLIGFVPSMGGASPAETAAYKKAPCGTANVAVGISKLGGSSAFISKVGANECGYMLADILKKNNVDTSGMRFDSNARTTLGFITLGADCKREILFFRNPKSDMLLDKSELDHNLIKKAKIFHYGSISLIDEPCKSAHLAALRIAKDSDCILSYDPNLRLTPWPSDEAARTGIMSIWDLADVIKISEDEITFLTGGGDPYDDDVVLNKLFHPNLKLLIVTGSKGCRYYTKGFKGKVRDVNVEPVDTTGAGDAFVSGILYNIASDPSIFEDEERIRKALCFSNSCGAITGTERGAIPGLLAKDVVQQSDSI